ncbi:MAG: hypothetical protein U5L11_00765 [Arhodomonas sp.]|nr:hypothetical protein [Arhodomonas sp.]
MIPVSPALLHSVTSKPTSELGLGLGPDSPNASAETSFTDILAVVGNDGPGGVESNTLVGSLSVSGNTVSSSATGNEALAGEGMVAGNQIVFDDTMNFDGIGTVGPGGFLRMPDSEAEGLVEADLGLFSFQANNGGDGTSSLTENTEIGALVQNLDSGSVTVSGNTAESRARGNTVSNAIVAPGDEPANATFNGSAALSNGQVNFNSDVTAEITDTLLGAQIGNAFDTNAAPTDAASVTGGQIIVEDNAAVANAIANQAGNTVSLGGADLALTDDGTNGLGDGLASLTAGNRDEGDATSGGGATLSNVQANINSAVSASNTNTRIALDGG